MQLIFTPDETGTDRATGYATIPYSSDAEDETLVETTEEALTAVFQAAADNSVTELPETGNSIDAAVESPLDFRDFLALEGGEIVFDDDYTRPVDDG